MQGHILGMVMSSGGSKGEGGATYGPKFVLISCAFLEESAKSYVGAPWAVADPRDGATYGPKFFLIS